MEKGKSRVRTGKFLSDSEFLEKDKAEKITEYGVSEESREEAK